VRGPRAQGSRDGTKRGKRRKDREQEKKKEQADGLNEVQKKEERKEGRRERSKGTAPNSNRIGTVGHFKWTAHLKYTADHYYTAVDMRVLWSRERDLFPLLSVFLIRKQCMRGV
jgi:hypothetical protein